MKLNAGNINNKFGVKAGRTPLLLGMQSPRNLLVVASYQALIENVIDTSKSLCDSDSDQEEKRTHIKRQISNFGHGGGVRVECCVCKTAPECPSKFPTNGGIVDLEVVKDSYCTSQASEVPPDRGEVKDGSKWFELGLGLQNSRFLFKLPGLLPRVHGFVTRQNCLFINRKWISEMAYMLICFQSFKRKKRRDILLCDIEIYTSFVLPVVNCGTELFQCTKQNCKTAAGKSCLASTEISIAEKRDLVPSDMCTHSCNQDKENSVVSNKESGKRYKRQCSCFFLETGTSKYPSIGSNSVALVNQVFGVAEEQVTPISTTYGSVMFLTKLFTHPAVTRAMGTCYLGFSSKAALKPSHPQCLVSDCTSVCHHSCCVGSVVCGAVLKQITELCKLKYPQVNKKKIVFNDPVSGAVLLGSMDIIEETVA
ncbi:hypothetical protein Anapl_09459 [Anas platyrhynchos]|uniref:Uncharacterized protein n=1 Tax=Anas platyrhynchos TaxID=8839 RepID=R0LQA3_ANAPL|nr:hypothetical protein Anapl_09459 [Anas platyrhynchos]